MTEMLLFVDDEPNILESYTRQLRKKFDVLTAPSGDAALELVQQKGPFAIVVSDLRMPGMDGIQFLTRVKGLSPDTVRMMLTGYADVDTAIKAVNEGSVFRFLTKPCDTETMVRALIDGIRQYRLIVAERELLEQTVSGAVSVLSEVLSIVNPEAFGRAAAIKHDVLKTGEIMHYPQAWELETAVLLSQIGCVAVPQEVLDKVGRGARLDAMEAKAFARHPAVAADLLTKIPRLETVARIVAYQEKHWDGTGIPADSCVGGEIPLGARIIKVALDFDALQAAGQPKSKSLEALIQRTGWYDPDVLLAFQEVIRQESKYELAELMVNQLAPFMILAEDASTPLGRKLAARGLELTDLMINHLKAFARSQGLKQPLKVIIPL